MKNYVIIGGSSGIGKQLVSDLLNAGHQVISTFNSRRSDLSHPGLSEHPVDVISNEISFEFLPEQIDGLVYCPGAIKLRPFHRLKPEEFMKDYELQVVGAVKVVQAALPALKKSEHASVVLFSTVAVQNGFNFHSMISSSKGAIEGLVRALAAEYSPKIRFNCVAPSLTDTPLAQALLNTDDKRKANAQRHPLQSIGEASDMANAASFLLSNKSKWITGQVIKVDGGISVIR